MNDFYDKLGNLLNEALENEEIPKKAKDTEEKINEENFSSNQSPKEESHKKKTFKIKIHNKKSNNVGEVIKNTDSHPDLNSQTIFIPKEIQEATKVLELTYPFSQEELRKKYHELLLKFHPDSTKTTVEDPAILLKLRQLQTEKLNSAYNEVKNWLQNQNSD